ncbi:MAG: hypothetical protein GYB36_09695 [Alphaproteobacteria bacterium]|nr:hypothetical protein [Alphaproteobacteria bacterium]
MFNWMHGTALALTLGVTAMGAAEEPTAPWEEDLDAFLTVLVAEHDNPYFLTPQIEFDAAIADYRAALSDMDRAERIAGLARIIALVGDGHTWMPMHAMPFDGLPPGPGFRSLPVRFEWFDEGLFIVGTGQAHAHLLGQRVEGFGDVSAEDVISRVMELLPRDAVNFASEFVAEWLMQAELLAALDLAESPDDIRLTLAGEEVSLRPLEAGIAYDWIFSGDSGYGADDWRIAAAQTPLWREAFNGPWRVEALEEAVYVQITQIGDAAERSYAEMARSAVAQALLLDEPALVLDLRRCLGGDGSLNPGLMEALVSVPELEGRIQVLTSRMTHSAAVMLVSDLEQQTSARFYGQPTADRPNHYGETNIFVTPNSLLPIIHASEYYQTSHADDDRRFVTPDVVIPYRFSDYVAGTDPVLARALQDLSE